MPLDSPFFLFTSMFNVKSSMFDVQSSAPSSFSHSKSKNLSRHSLGDDGFNIQNPPSSPPPSGICLSISAFQNLCFSAFTQNPLPLSAFQRLSFSALTSCERLNDLNVGTTPLAEGTPHERPQKPLLLLAALKPTWAECQKPKEPECKTPRVRRHHLAP